MKKFTLCFVSFLAIITLVGQSTIQACTTFCLFNGKDLIFGRNYDFPIGYGHVVINKRGVVKSAMADAGEQAAQWTSKYGSLTFNQFGRDNPMGGMNEAGLIVELMQLDATYPEDERAHNLLGNYFFGQQEFTQAIEEYKKVTAIAPNFSPPYNQLGYAYRSLENHAEAEKAFQKYIKLIPDDPNPYDSYAELLLKIGRFDESIKQYQAALSRNPNFAASYFGIATDLSLQNKHAEALAQLQKAYDIARDDGERRGALFARTVVYVDAGNVQMAFAELDKQYALGEKIDDAAAMSGDLGTMGNILYETGKYDEALAKFEKSLQLTEASNLSAAIKENAKRGQLYNAGRVALMKKDLAAAKAKAEEFRAQSEAAKNTFQIWLAHELAGSIALAEKKYDQAIQHFQQANQQDPYIFYRLALAYEGKGDMKNAKAACLKAARFNALNNLNYAFMRKKAEQKLAAMSRS